MRLGKGVDYMASTTITMRIDEETKAQLQDLTTKLGMDVSTYLLMAVKQGIREQALPFHPSLSEDNLAQARRWEAYEKLKQLRVKGTVTDDKAELNRYRDEKYGK
jgi:DNA-damage-inducible protein J